MNTLDLRYVLAEKISGLIFSGVVVLAALIAIGFLWFFSGTGIAFYLSVGGFIGLTSLLMFFSLVWPQISFRHYRWRLDEESLEIHRGVFWRHRTAIPLGRVQHADVSQGPLLRHFGLGTLVVHTAGTLHSMVQIEGLSHETAVSLRNRLVQQTQAGNAI